MKTTTATLHIFIAVFFHSFELSSQVKRFEFPKHIALEDIPDLIMPRGYPRSFEGAFIGSEYKDQILPFTQHGQIVIVREPFNIVEPIPEPEWLEMRKNYIKYASARGSALLPINEDVHSISVRRQIRINAHQSHHINAENERQQALLMNHEDLRRLGGVTHVRVNPLNTGNKREIDTPAQLTSWPGRQASEISNLRVNPINTGKEHKSDTPKSRRPPRLTRWPGRPGSGMSDLRVSPVKAELEHQIDTRRPPSAPKLIRWPAARHGSK